MSSNINLDQLQSHTNKATWQRGEKYYRENRVHELTRTDSKITARVKGSDSYRVTVTLKQNGDFSYQCNCPVNDDGSCCKHIVAVAIAASKGESNDAPEEKSATQSLRAFLLAQPQAWLAETLANLAKNDTDIERQLKFQQHLLGATDLASLKKAISTLLGRPRFLDYRKSRDFSYKINELNTLLRQIDSAGKHGECVALSEYALERLIKLYAESDDSAGYMGGEIADTGEIYRNAAVSADNTSKPKPANFLKLLMLDGWNIIPKDDYQAMLGELGYAELERKIESAWANLKPSNVHGHYDAERYTIERLMENIAIQRGDVDLLIRMYSQALHYPGRYHQIVKLCQAHQRTREAITWAERGVKAHPRDNTLRSMLAAMYLQDGLDAEALELLWQNFRHSCTGDNYMALKQHSGNAWPEWREKALALLIKAEQSSNAYYLNAYPGGNARPDCSLRASCLLAEGCVDELRDLLNTHVCQADILLQLARVISKMHPQEATLHMQSVISDCLTHADNKNYQSATSLLRELRTWMPEGTFNTYVQILRVQHKARKNLISMLQVF
ncbi:MAG: SWIM zinc finger family protein [Methylotenera sp.]|nr:SWIM zinc finger family protein [Methylotenera sp.]